MILLQQSQPCFSEVTLRSTLPALIHVIVQSAFFIMLHQTSKYGTLWRSSGRNVLKWMFCLFSQTHLCRREYLIVFRRLNFTDRAKHICLTFMGQLSTSSSICWGIENHVCISLSTMPALFMYLQALSQTTLPLEKWQSTDLFYWAFHRHLNETLSFKPIIIPYIS